MLPTGILLLENTEKVKDIVYNIQETSKNTIQLRKFILRPKLKSDHLSLQNVKTDTENSMRDQNSVRTESQMRFLLPKGKAKQQDRLLKRTCRVDFGCLGIQNSAKLVFTDGS